jgi:hypothetical protein
VTAPLEQCFALLAAIDHYPEWCPDVVRYVEVLERDARGQPERVSMMIHLALAIDPPRSVTLTRVTDHPTNQEFTAVWLVHPDKRTRIGLQLEAKLRVPALVPAAGIPDEIANAFVAAAARTLASPPQERALRSD